MWFRLHIGRSTNPIKGGVGLMKKLWGFIKRVATPQNIIKACRVVIFALETFTA